MYICMLFFGLKCDTYRLGHGQRCPPLSIARKKYAPDLGSIARRRPPPTHGIDNKPIRKTIHSSRTKMEQGPEWQRRGQD